jgi:MSHA biogenesis protein MshK
MRGGLVFRSAVKLLCLASLFAAAPVVALDPTQPPAGRAAGDAPVDAAASLHLQAILRGPGRASAVINGNSLQVGDRVGDARILAIHRHAVLIDRQGQQQELHLSAPITQTSRTQP